MPQPIDLQTEMARVNAVERIQQVAGRVSLAGQQRVEAELLKQGLQAETQVQQTRPKGEQVEPELRRRNPFAGRRRRQPGRRQAPEDPVPKKATPREAEPGGEPHQLDITV